MSPKNPFQFQSKSRYGFAFLLCIITYFTNINANALEADEILIIANQNSTSSITLARYYMQKRSVPVGNLITLKVTNNETCLRDEYEKMIATPLRAFLKKDSNSKHRIRCLIVMFGLPLRIANFSGLRTNPYGLVPYGMNDFGEMVGNIPFEPDTAYIYRNGMFEAIGDYIYPSGINNVGEVVLWKLGQVVGSYSGENGVEGFIYEHGEFTSIPFKHPRDINDYGDIVGVANTGGYRS